MASRQIKTSPRHFVNKSIGKVKTAIKAVGNRNNVRATLLTSMKKSEGAERTRLAHILKRTRKSLRSAPHAQMKRLKGSKSVI